jgi:hypothetical protein
MNTVSFLVMASTRAETVGVRQILQLGRVPWRSSVGSLDLCAMARSSRFPIQRDGEPRRFCGGGLATTVRKMGCCSCVVIVVVALFVAAVHVVDIVWF